MRPEREWVFVVGQSILALLLLSAVGRTPSAGRTGWSEVGFVLIGLSALLGSVALWQARPFLRVRPSPRQDAELLTAGIYSRIRHPMYWAVHLVSAGLVLHRPSPWTLSVAIVQYAFYWAKARYEERRLLEHYPDYSAYRRRTWGLWP